MDKMSKANKHIENGRMLKKTGSWLYCNQCNKTVGYLCYSTYQNFDFSFHCNCGNNGLFSLSFETEQNIQESKDELLLKKNRFCCPNDEAPLFSIVDKHIEAYSYSVTCNKCYSQFQYNR
ncbi:MAG: hypothetical protein ABIJ59_17855 [Pseudomonadota bacterium]